MAKTHKTLTIVAVVIALFLSVANSIPTSRNAPLELRILHNNDMHARFEQTAANSNTCSKEDVANNRCYGGFARVAFEYTIFHIL